ncbi:MAG: SPOR domain-containing protein [Flavobacterium sp.]|uniref:SPOR domain-containing protein n=1 Tax=Flavobacterium sp. TaxID=239 RepID=UPI001205025A|nr:SPOR domain-containing protein [Flavobacterium sp.]RZJ64331.1 MAG: SPOR domain-containing protein [Flavobacterium sp.]
MKLHASKFLFFCLSAGIFLPLKSFSQASDVTVSQDPKFEQLLNEKRRINSSITVNDKYKIQIFNGDSESSKKILNDFRKDNKNLDATVVFSTPAYKVWVGNFKSRIEAERNLADLRKKYPNAIIIKPNK